MTGPTRRGRCSALGRMKPPVLVVATSAAARAIRVALAERLALTITDDLERGRALASTGGFLVIVAVAPLA